MLTNNLNQFFQPGFSDEFHLSSHKGQLEGGRLCEDVFCRRIPVGLEFIGHEPDAHSKAVDEVEGLSHCVENLEQFCRRNNDGCGWEMLCVPGYQV